MTTPNDFRDIVIYHNPECGTSRNALALIRNAGIDGALAATGATAMPHILRSQAGRLRKGEKLRGLLACLD